MASQANRTVMSRTVPACRDEDRLFGTPEIGTFGRQPLPTRLAAVRCNDVRQLTLPFRFFAGMASIVPDHSWDRERLRDRCERFISDLLNGRV